MQTAISRIAEAGRLEKQMQKDALSLMFSKSDGEAEEAVPCNHAVSGCEWVGTATERAKHLCDFDLVPCPHAAQGCRVENATFEHYLLIRIFKNIIS